MKGLNRSFKSLSKVFKTYFSKAFARQFSEVSIISETSSKTFTYIICLKIKKSKIVLTLK